jgi:hypothetical protein
MYTEEDIDEAKRVLKESGYVFVLWSIEDINYAIAENDANPDHYTEDEKLDLLKNIIHNEYGIQKINEMIDQDVYNKLIKDN